MLIADVFTQSDTDAPTIPHTLSSEIAPLLIFGFFHYTKIYINLFQIA